MLLETERRVLANLSEPRSVPNLTRVLRHDPHGPFDADEPYLQVQAQVTDLVVDLVERELIVRVGSHTEAKSALRAVAQNDEAVKIPKVKADALSERLQSGRDGRLDTGELLILSNAGLEALVA